MTKPRHLGIALTVISTAQLMVVLDVTIVNVALPSIQRGLHFSTSNLVWVTTAYALTFGGLLLFGGRTGDLFGRRRMFMFGAGLFAFASLLGGLAQDDVWLVVTRAVQGIGGAIMSPTALALIATNFPEGQARNRAMGVYAAVSGAGAAVGLLAGGLLTDLASWRWVLFVNVPIAAALLALTPQVLEESETRPGELDIPGAVTATLGMASLVYGLTHAASSSWGNPQTVGCLVAAGVLLGGFVGWEMRARHPLMPLRMFADRNRSGAYGIMLCLGASMFAVFFFLTLYLQDVLGFSPLKAGVAFLPISAMIVVTAQTSSRLVGRIGPRWLLLAGPACAAGAFLWMSGLTPDSGYLGVLGPLLLLAVGMGLAFVPLTITAVAGVRPEESGLASALLNTGQQVGGAVGLSLLSTVAVDTIRPRLLHLLATHGGHLTPALVKAATTHGYDRAFLVAAGIAAVGFVVSALAVRGRIVAPSGPTSGPEVPVAVG